MTQLALFSARLEKRSRPRGLLARVGAWVSQVAWWLVARLIPAKKEKPKKPRHQTREMILDAYDCAFNLWRGGGRALTKSEYCDRWARGYDESRGRRWSTLRATLRWLGVEFETYADEAGVLIASPLAAMKAAEKALPTVGPASDREDREHEAARRDAEVWIGLGVARVHGPMGVSGVEGLVRLAGVLR